MPLWLEAGFARVSCVAGAEEAERHHNREQLRSSPGSI